MTDEINMTSENQETTAPADVQADVHNTHQAASAHFSNSETSIGPTHSELRADADRAANIINNLHQTVASSTPEGTAAETMHTDKKNANHAQAEIENGADPLAAYAGYSAYAVPQPEKKDGFRNYYENPLTYDEYSVDKDKNKFSVNYNLTELTPGGEARSMNDPNTIVGTGIEEKSFSYNEKKSGSKTIVTTERTLSGTRTPTSYHINDGETQIIGFTNKKNGTYIYDKNDNLIEQTNHSESNNVITDSNAIAHKGQDMSRGESKGYFHTYTDITALRNQYTRFSYTELDKNGVETETLTGDLRKNSESYIHQKDGTVTEAYHYLNDKKEWIYNGSITLTDGTFVEDFSPEKAEKEFNRLKKTTNKHIKILTGANDMESYTQQLGAPKPTHNLDTYFNGKATPEDKAKAEQINADVAQKYAHTPAAIVALKTNSR